HDDGVKTVLGRTGPWTGDDVIDILLEHPAAGSHLARKLFRYFAYDEPEFTVVERLAGEFRRSNYDLPTLVPAILRSPPLRPHPPPLSRARGRWRWGRRGPSASTARPATCRCNCGAWGRTCSTRPASRAGMAARRGSTRRRWSSGSTSRIAWPPCVGTAARAI